MKKITYMENNTKSSKQPVYNLLDAADNNNTNTELQHKQQSKPITDLLSFASIDTNNKQTNLKTPNSTIASPSSNTNQPSFFVPFLSIHNVSFLPLSKASKKLLNKIEQLATAISKQKINISIDIFKELYLQSFLLGESVINEVISISASQQELEDNLHKVILLRKDYLYELLSIEALFANYIHTTNNTDLTDGLFNDVLNYVLENFNIPNDHKTWHTDLLHLRNERNNQAHLSFMKTSINEFKNGLAAIKTFKEYLTMHFLANARSFDASNNNNLTNAEKEFYSDVLTFNKHEFNILDVLQIANKNNNSKPIPQFDFKEKAYSLFCKFNSNSPTNKNIFDALFNSTKPYFAYRIFNLWRNKKDVSFKKGEQLAKNNEQEITSLSIPLLKQGFKGNEFEQYLDILIELSAYSKQEDLIELVLKAPSKQALQGLLNLLNSFKVCLNKIDKKVFELIRQSNSSFDKLILEFLNIMICVLQCQNTDIVNYYDPVFFNAGVYLLDLVTSNYTSKYGKKESKIDLITYFNFLKLNNNAFEEQETVAKPISKDVFLWNLPVETNKFYNLNFKKVSKNQFHKDSNKPTLLEDIQNQIKEKNKKQVHKNKDFVNKGFVYLKKSALKK